MVERECFRLAQAHDQYAPGRDPAQAMDDGYLAAPAGDLTVADQRCDGPAERTIDRAGATTGAGDALEQVHDQRLCLEPADVTGLDPNRHHVAILSRAALILRGAGTSVCPDGDPLQFDGPAPWGRPIERAIPATISPVPSLQWEGTGVYAWQRYAVAVGGGGVGPAAPAAVVAVAVAVGVGAGVALAAGAGVGDAPGAAVGDGGATYWKPLGPASFSGPVS